MLWERAHAYGLCRKLEKRALHVLKLVKSAWLHMALAWPPWRVLQGDRYALAAQDRRRFYDLPSKCLKMWELAR